MICPYDNSILGSFAYEMQHLGGGKLYDIPHNFLPNLRNLLDAQYTKLDSNSSLESKNFHDY